MRSRLRSSAATLLLAVALLISKSAVEASRARSAAFAEVQAKNEPETVCLVQFACLSNVVRLQCRFAVRLLVLVNLPSLACDAFGMPPQARARRAANYIGPEDAAVAHRKLMQV